MKRILCPTDFSEASLNAIEFAAKIGETHNSQLTLLYIIRQDQIKEVIKKGGKDLSIEEWNYLAEEKLKNLVAEISEISENHGLLRCDYKILIGNLEKSIVEFAKDNRYDLIVMGTSGVRDVTEQYMGNTTFKVIHTSQCPIICVPIRAQYDGFKKVVYATDYQEEDKIMVQELIYFCYPFNAELDILHISKTDSIIDQAMYEQFKTDIKNFIQYENINFVKKVYKNDVSTGIDKYMLDEKATLLVLLERHRNYFDQVFHKSVVKHMSYFTDYPILVFKS
ncbi:MAG: universal stress protein [Bacteroidota bacterium]|nr:universal stress protein [Bacteroidota bacterium]